MVGLEHAAEAMGDDLAVIEQSDAGASLTGHAVTIYAGGSLMDATAPNEHWYALIPTPTGGALAASSASRDSTMPSTR